MSWPLWSCWCILDAFLIIRNYSVVLVLTYTALHFSMVSQQWIWTELVHMVDIPYEPFFSSFALLEEKCGLPTHWNNMFIFLQMQIYMHIHAANFRKRFHFRFFCCCCCFLCISSHRSCWESNQDQMEESTGNTDPCEDGITESWVCSFAFH